jgi:DNA-binding IclR family transcriptional regulator
MAEALSILKTVDKALRVLELLHEEKREMGITEITHRLMINKSTTYRILTTLCRHRFVQKNPANNKYKLGFKILEISSTILETINLRDLARPFLEKLRNTTNETVNLITLDEGMGVYIDRLESQHTIRMVSHIGTREELHCTGVGKALLAFLPEDQMDNVIKRYGLPRKTSATITDVSQLKEHLQMIRERGYSLDNEEAEEGIRCVGAPIFNHGEEVIAAISIAAPSYRLSVKMAHEHAHVVVETAAQISEALGKTPA